MNGYLDAGLAREAVSAGAVFLDGTTARVSLVREGNRLAVALERRGIQETTHARVVVIAGGLAPAGMQRARGLATRIAPEARVGAGCLLADSEDTLNYESHAIHMAVGRGGYVGVVRLAGGFLNVAAAFDREFVRERGGPGPAAVAILAEARAHPLPQLVGADWSGTAPLTRSTRPVAGHRVLLVGDVAGYVEPFTGEGMGAALLGGRAVADVALRGIDDWAPTLASEWARRHRCLVARRHAVIRALATAARRPWLARAVLGLAARSPRFSGALIRRVNPSP